MNILVHSHLFSKYKGSEFAVAYNFALNMNARHHLYFIVESTSYSWGDLEELKTVSIPNVDFVAIDKKIIERGFFKIYIKVFLRLFGGWASYLYLKKWEKAMTISKYSFCKIT